MKNIKLNDPQSHKDIEVEISAEEFNLQQAWRVKFQDGRSTLLGLDQHRIWKQFDGNELDAELVGTIGKAIESQENSSS